MSFSLSARSIFLSGSSVLSVHGILDYRNIIKKINEWNEWSDLALILMSLSLSARSILLS